MTDWNGGFLSSKARPLRYGLKGRWVPETIQDG
jgi:hypothetical protein